MRFALFFAMTLTAEPVAEFYKAYQARPFTGTPDEKQLVRIEKYLSKALVESLRTARQVQTVCAKKHPEEKPPYIEGDMFSSNFEGFTHFQVLDTTGNRTRVAFEYTYRGQTVKWVDEILLIRENGRLVIDDIRYERAKETLRQSFHFEKACD